LDREEDRREVTLCVAPLSFEWLVVLRAFGVLLTPQDDGSFYLLTLEHDEIRRDAAAWFAAA
jgi:hypothetical protein